MEAGVEIGSQRNLNDGDVGVGVHQQQRHEHAMVEASVGIHTMVDAGGVEQTADSFGEAR